MTDSFWPILGLDEGASESEVRRAYAKQLRRQGADADVATFQALRAEFESALAAARTGLPARIEALAIRTGATKSMIVERSTRPLERERLEPEPFEPEPLREEPRSRKTNVPERSSRAIDEIEDLLSDGDLLGACDRFDLARASNEIDFGEEAQLETDLAHQWLANTTLDSTALAAIVRRYRWDDVVSGFTLGPQIVERLHAEAKAEVKPGTRFIGKWNWGAFCLTPFWLMSHGLKRNGIRLLILEVVLLIVPFGPIGILVLAVNYGKKGNALAVRHRKFASEREFIAVQDAWRNWGISIWLAVPVALVVLLAWIGSLQP